MSKDIKTVLWRGQHVLEGAEERLELILAAEHITRIEVHTPRIVHGPDRVPIKITGYDKNRRCILADLYSNHAVQKADIYTTNIQEAAKHIS
jgi:hypothetical protein